MSVMLSVQFKIMTELTSSCEKLDKALAALKAVLKAITVNAQVAMAAKREFLLFIFPLYFKNYKTGDTNQTQSPFITAKNCVVFTAAALFLSLLKK